MPDVYTVNSRAFDGRLKRSWTGKANEDVAEHLLIEGVFPSAVDHPVLGHIAAGTVSYEYFWPDRWYNVFRFHEPHGDFRNFYCNISMPPKMQPGVIDYVDLDIDILVTREWTVSVLDEDEFEQNTLLMSYPETVVRTVRETITKLLASIHRREFPFDTQF